MDLGVGVVEVRLVAADGSADPSTPPDQLAADDRAWAIVPPDRPREILLVGDGDPYLETALSYLPNTSLFGVKADRYPADAQRRDGTDWDLIIFEGFVPATLPSTPTLVIGPPRTSPIGTVTGKLTNPGIGTLSPDEPILRYVDLSTIHIAEAARLELPAWARSVIPGPRGAPLLYAGVRAGVPSAVLAFEPRRSDLPLQVAFPILIANLTGELMGGSAAPADAVKPGDPVSLPIPTGATGLRIERPDGSVVELAPGIAGGSSVTFTQTDLLGVYVATAIRPAPTEASGSPPPTPSQTPLPSATPRPSGAGTGSGRVDPNAPIRFAVDLFDVAESTITPGIRRRPREARPCGGRPRRVGRARCLCCAGCRRRRVAAAGPRRALVPDRPDRADRPVCRVGALSPRRRDPGLARPVEPGPAARTRECLTWASPSTRRSRCYCSFPLSA